MPLFFTVVTTWSTKRPDKLLGKAYEDYFLLNTNRIVDMIAVGDDSSRFLYCQAPDDSRCSPDVIECVHTPDEIIAHHDTVEASKFGTFAIFPGYDITATPVDTTIEWADVDFIYQTSRDRSDGVCHMVYYKDAWKRTECMIDMSITDVLTAEY